MADITDHNDQGSPSALDDAHAVGNGNAIPSVGDNRGVKRPRPSTAGDDDDDDDDKPGRERRKIEIKFITDKSRRHITFSKRKAGIMKKVSHPASPSRKTRRVSIQLVPRIVLTRTPRVGLRAFRAHWDASLASRGLGDRSRLHIHDAKASTTRHKGRGQEPHSGMIEEVQHAGGQTLTRQCRLA